MDDPKPFGELSREEQEALVIAAYVDKKSVLYKAYLKDKWQVISRPSFLEQCYYRIKLEPARIDWSHVAPEYKYLWRRSVDGQWWLCRQKGIPHVQAEYFASFLPGDPDIVVERPSDD